MDKKFTCLPEVFRAESANRALLVRSHERRQTREEEGNTMTNTNFKPIAVTPHFYQLGTPFFPVYLSMGAEGMLIEGGISATYDIIIEQIQELGIAPERIKYMALTHTHVDHIGALPRLKASWPHIQSIASPLAEKILGNGKMRKQFESVDTGISEIMKTKAEIPEVPSKLDVYDFSVDIVANGDNRFDLGEGIVWHAHHTPGHAACQMAFIEEKEGTLAIGDATGFYNPDEDVFWPNYFESLPRYVESIRKLAGLPAKRVALSHNGVIQGDVKNFFRRALKTTKDYHKEMLARIGKGENPKNIAAEKAQWVLKIADHMPFSVMPVLCQELIKQSQKADGGVELNFDI